MNQGDGVRTMHIDGSMITTICFHVIHLIIMLMVKVDAVLTLGAPNYQMRSNVIIYKPTINGYNGSRKDVIMYKYFRPVHGALLNLRNRNDRPSFHGNNYALLENSVDNLLPILT